MYSMSLNSNAEIWRAMRTAVVPPAAEWVVISEMIDSLSGKYSYLLGDSTVTFRAGTLLADSDASLVTRYYVADGAFTMRAREGLDTVPIRGLARIRPRTFVQNLLAKPPGDGSFYLIGSPLLRANLGNVSLSQPTSISFRTVWLFQNRWVAGGFAGAMISVIPYVLPTEGVDVNWYGIGVRAAGGFASGAVGAMIYPLIKNPVLVFFASAAASFAVDFVINHGAERAFA